MAVHSTESEKNVAPNYADPDFIGHLTRHSFAMVLAGGRGKRLERLTEWRSKPAVPFGGKFRIIDFTLSNCVNAGVRRIGVVTQYKSGSLIRHIQQGWSFLDGRFHEYVQLLPAQQKTGELWYQGTADAIYQNLDAVRAAHPEYVIILSGDHIYKMDYAKMLLCHVQNKADMTVACIEVPIDEASSFGVMEIDDKNRVIGFEEKPPKPKAIPGQPKKALASMGIYVFNTAFLEEQLERDHKDDPLKRVNKNIPSEHDFGKDVIPYIYPDCRVFAHRFSDSCVGKTESGESYWRDVGTVDAYWGANLDLTNVVPELNLYDEEWPIWTYQEQLPPAKFVFDEDTGRRGMAIDSTVSGGCIISGASIKRSLLFSSVRVHSRAKVEDSVILPEVDIGENAIIRRAVIDKRCRIRAGMRIGVDPEEDRKNKFYISEKGIVLVTPEMLDQKAHHKV